MRRQLNDKCGDGKTERETTQTEQGRITLALSWDFTQLLTFSRTSENGHVSKNLTRSSGPGGRAEAGKKIWTFGTGSTQQYNSTAQRRIPLTSEGEGQMGQTDTGDCFMDPYRRRTVPDFYGATAIDRAEGNVMR